MTSYNKLIIFIVVLVLFSAAVVFLSNTDNNSANKLMPEISSNIAEGDSQYNEAVDLLNNKSYDEAKNKAVSAGNNFNHTYTDLLSIKDNFTPETDDVHKNYINTLLNEVGLKINATNSLLDSIDKFKSYQNATGNDNARQANEYMQDAVEFQNVRNNLSSNNPNLFK